MNLATLRLVGIMAATSVRAEYFGCEPASGPLAASTASGASKVNPAPTAEVKATAKIQPVPLVQIGPVDITEGAQSDATRVVAGMRASFRNCYRYELRMNPLARGDIRFALMIGAHGEVLQTGETASGSLGGVTLCAAARARCGQFTPPTTGRSVVRFRVEFNRQ